LKASHKEHDLMVGYQQIHLMPGDFIFGRKAASEELGINESKIYRFVEHLKSAGNLNIKPNNKFSVISIINWNSYQGDDCENEQQVNNHRTTTEQQLNTNKNGKNGKKYSNALFERFWRAYPKKKSIGQAQKVFIRINPDEQLLASMIAKIEQAKKSEQWLKDGGQFIPYPATWLNAKGWEDEIETKPQATW
jgi:hypothetical protein